jgi:hypothetical protein
VPLQQRRQLLHVLAGQRVSPDYPNGDKAQLFQLIALFLFAAEYQRRNQLSYNQKADPAYLLKRKLVSMEYGRRIILHPHYREFQAFIRLLGHVPSHLFR